jgi:hypothetical protein
VSSGEAKVFERGGRGSLVGGDRDVADVAEIFHAFGRGVKTAGSEVAEFVKKERGGFEFGLGLGDVADVVAESALLAGDEIGEVVAEAFLGFGVDPDEAVEDEGAVFVVAGIGRADPFVDEVGYADGGGRGGFRVGGDDDVAERGGGAALTGGKREAQKSPGL